MKKIFSLFFVLTSLSMNAFSFSVSGSAPAVIGTPISATPPVLPVIGTPVVVNPRVDATLAISDVAVSNPNPVFAGGIISVTPVRGVIDVDLSGGSIVAAPPCSDNSISCKILLRRHSALAATNKGKTIAQLDAMKTGTDACSGSVFAAYGNSTTMASINACEQNMAVNTNTALVSSGTLSTATVAAPSATSFSAAQTSYSASAFVSGGN